MVEGDRPLDLGRVASGPPVAEVVTHPVRSRQEPLADGDPGEHSGDGLLRRRDVLRCVGGFPALVDDGLAVPEDDEVGAVARTWPGRLRGRTRPEVTLRPRRGDGVNEMAERWFLDDEPDARFRLYCRGNVGEIVPEACTPLTATTVTGAFQRAFGELFTSTGAFTDEELRGGAVVGGIFGGYLYFNLSFAGVFAARVPGIRVRDIDEQMMGRSDAPPYRRQRGDRTVGTVARTVVGTVRSLIGRERIDLDEARAEVVAWLAALPVDPTDAEVVALAAGYEDRFVHHLDALPSSSLGGALPMALLRD